MLPYNLRRATKSEPQFTETGALEPNAQGCAFAHPLFEFQLSKLEILRTHFLGFISNLRTQF